jgi:cytochrome c553
VTTSTPNSRIQLIVFIIVAALCLHGARATRAQERQMPPAWPYAQPQLPPGEIPPQVAAPRPPAATNPPATNPDAPPPAVLQAKGSSLQFTQQQVSNSYAPADWFPDSHPPMPEVVSHGKPGVARACGLCHLPDGRGRPENAPLQGLPHDYIVQQLRDFQQGLRHSADPRKANTLEMENIAKTLTDDEIKDAAKYFSSIKVPKYVRVVETEKVPATRVQGEIYFTAEGPEEPIGVRVIETPEDAAETRLRSPRSGFIAYAPVGSIKRGEALATTGADGKTTPCTVCHGPELKGLGPVPNLAGRSPSYLARQMYDMKLGTRKGAMAALMMPVLARLTDADIVDLVAYIASREP